MSTSILYHGFGIQEHRYLRTEYSGGALVFHLERASDRQRCTLCGSSQVIRKGQRIRRIRTVPVGSKPVFLALHVHRLQCRSCGGLRQEPIGVSFPKKRWTRMLARYVVELLRHVTVEDVARHLRMSWDTVKEIHAFALEKKFRHRRIAHLQYLGVDEVAVRRGHRYLTLVVNLESGEVVWVGQGREASSLEPFLKRLRSARTPLRAIALDMWPAYLRAILAHYPQEVIVFDRYHVIADYNRLLDQLRTRECQQAAPEEKRVYRGVRYLLLKGQEKLEGHPRAKARLEELLLLNQNLNTAYLLKEELREFWNCSSRAEAEEYLESWLTQAESSGIDLLMGFAAKLASHGYGLLNYFDHPISTAQVEGTNNKIKVLKRQAYGFRDMHYFKLRIYNLHESRYALVG
jgi:transposase